MVAAKAPLLLSSVWKVVSKECQSRGNADQDGACLNLQPPEILSAQATLQSHSSPAPPLSTIADRMGVPVLGEKVDCEAIRPLWQARSADLDCLDFMTQHWEQTPRLAQPGPAWTNSLLSLKNISSMITTWPFRIHKNHGTALFHTPNSGFLADTRWKRGEPVPADAVEIAIREQLTFVAHNLEVYWPPISELVLHVVRFFHTYVQVNLYVSPPGLAVATAPHQDAHSTFIVQVHGAKRWMVHAPWMPLTPKGMQRGKRGELLTPGDARFMGPALINETLHSGSVLYVPRAFFHHTSTETAEEDTEPSVALTFSILSEDTFQTWLQLLGEALQMLPQQEATVAALRRQAVRTPSTAIGEQLREMLPRALLARPTDAANSTFASGTAVRMGWWRYATRLVVGALADDGVSQPWPLRKDVKAKSRFLHAIDEVLQRKRKSREGKQTQIETFLNAITARDLSGANVDIDAIFSIEKQDKSWRPLDRSWFDIRVWQ